MTHDQAQQWAIARLKALLSNKLLRLNPNEALLACNAMSVLTNKQWIVVREEHNAQHAYRATETDQELNSPSTINTHKSGS